ncbi:DUF3800 domain-containing protein [Motiliproteus sp. MSK22-1]|uniref:DUF3800 domain-containing protein n=1 Tax=Motiliproteus sp. MSK22-1 TaxID=1897630 RepID=UPI000975AB86|nr:DUF3800 domain-containing protein [Motiliproteus sp. MSK22-1]OMH30091.1 hypothetical protein BGP75_19365 [Motiliproteus sp. MSK22-1]
MIQSPIVEGYRTTMNNMAPVLYSDYLVFVDESGDHSLTSIDEQYPVFVLCFCIVRKDLYFVSD